MADAHLDEDAKLLQALFLREQIAPELGTRSQQPLDVFLEVDEGNEPARRLYRRAGFREVGRRKGYYPAGKGAAALILRRDLA